MAESSSEPPLDSNDDNHPEINNDLDKMIEKMELISGGVANLSSQIDPTTLCPLVYMTMRTHSRALCSPAVQLTWMAYDMVALRTDPELEGSMRSLQEAYQRCRSVVLAGKEPEMDSNV